MTDGLVVEDVTKSYGGLVALSQVSMHARPGEVLGIIGPNGAGKTTLLDAIAGSTSVTEGRIMLYGIELSRLRAHEVARNGVFRTFQRAQVFKGLNSSECVDLAADMHSGGRMKGHSRVNTLDCLEWAGLKDRARRLAEELSLREHRLLEMACAKAANPSLLLLDEPVAGIDVNTRSRISEMLREFRTAGCVLVIVEHTLDMILEITDRLVVLNFGRKLAEGVPDEVIASDEVQRAYVRAGGT
jgi:ABC-type branched-subunit amino acid transport system ATPase component